MADVKLNVNCGCGYRTSRLEEANKHSDTTHHALTILGTMIPTDKNRPAEVKTTVVLREKESGEVSAESIKALRKKFYNG